MARGPALGGHVAEFRIESLLAEGSTGSVYVAEATAPGGSVALEVAEDERRGWSFRE